MDRFEVDRVYYYEEVMGNKLFPVAFYVISRTDKTVTIRDFRGNLACRRVYETANTSEVIRPFKDCKNELWASDEYYGDYWYQEVKRPSAWMSYM